MTDMQTTLQEQYTLNRQKYMAGEWTHAQFYLWLADAIGITVHDLPFTLEQVALSTDAHLNDLPLRHWDNRDGMVRYKARQAGMRGWSLSDTVCVLKAFARQEAAKLSEVASHKVDG